MITNPPYSGDHKSKLLHYLSTVHSSSHISAHNKRPFYLLLPVYISSKNYWQSFITSHTDLKVQYMLPPDSYCVSTVYVYLCIYSIITHMYI